MRTTISACLATLFFVSAAPIGAAAQEAARGYAAYTVYTYNGGPQGMAGRIRDAGTAITPIRNLRTGLNGDPQVEGVVPSGEKLRVAVTSRVAAPGAVPPTYIYNAVPATNPTPLASVTWPNVRNMAGLVRVGKYLYALDYDNARVVEINRSTFEETGVAYTLPASLTPNGYVAHGQAIVEIDGALYGLFSFTDSSWSSYAKSLLVRFTIKGGSSIKVGANNANPNFVANAFGLAVSGSDLYVAGLGGPQVSGTYNKKSRLQKIAYGATDLSAAKIKTVFKPSAENPYEVRDISFDGSTAYMLLGAYNASWQMSGKLVRTKNFTNLKTINDFSAGAPGYFWAAQYTPENNRIWFGRGNEILVYDAASPKTPKAALTLTAGSLIGSGDPYDNINDLAYVGAKGAVTTVRGYRSPVQASLSQRAAAARAVTQGRPELTPAEADLIGAEPAPAGK
ncbi:MAG: hypothetical protein DI565_17745 [Ancylobacter novellus]|uniref:Uncharacterized protein n=1 Tax=Ancylobacter novellus TaxID=921 RepID=A0A2W5K430_ANCNO|nr:MAG: hypothetical protein DI565_17745 [Ancylobacter novellus]